MPKPEGSSSNGLQPNMAAAISYVLGFITGIFFLVTSKDKFVRFHAMQSTITSIALVVLTTILQYLPGVYMLVPIVNLASLLLFVLLIVKAYQKEMYKLPYIGDIADKNS